MPVSTLRCQSAVLLPASECRDNGVDRLVGVVWTQATVLGPLALGRKGSSRASWIAATKGALPNPCVVAGWSLRDSKV